jgi:2-polyprenyl-3-methyl-5-hydroxy-6-metoxy-1,4-benzoquinol methylase
MKQDARLPSSNVPANPSRDQLGELFCNGMGLEIGAGLVPTRAAPGSSVRYADKRSDEELRAYFGSDQTVGVESLSSISHERFDFLIAHHVLEHSANVIETLVEWLGMIEEGGTLFLSLPNRHQTPDNLRLLTPPTHFLLDYSYGVTEDDYESREHICSFLWSWIDVGGLEGKTKMESASLVFAALHSEQNDLHWHTFNADTLEFVVRTAAGVLGLSAETLYLHDGYRSGSEHRGVFRIGKSANVRSARMKRLIEIKQEMRGLINELAIEGLEGKATFSLSRENRGKIFAVEEGKLRWVRSPVTLEERGLSDVDYTYLETSGMDPGLMGEEINVQARDRKSEIADRLKGLRSEPGIELSPGSHPMLEKSQFNVTYLDKMDHSTMATYLSGTPVPVDVVLGDRLIDEVLPHGSLSYIVSSHVIEHVPDFIQFFISSSRLLKPGGKIVMYVPDKRYTFDILRAVSNVDDIVAAHEARLRSPNRAMFIDAYANSDFQADTAGIWEGSYEPKPARTLEHATEIADGTDLSTADVHCFTFTPDSMRTLLDYVVSEHIPAFESVIVEDTRIGANEFIVEMTLTGQRLQ